jgi:hypothetical protein
MLSRRGMSSPTSRAITATMCDEFLLYPSKETAPALRLLYPSRCSEAERQLIEWFLGHVPTADEVADLIQGLVAWITVLQVGFYTQADGYVRLHQVPNTRDAMTLLSTRKTLQVVRPWFDALETCQRRIFERQSSAAELRDGAAATHALRQQLDEMRHSDAQTSRLVATKPPTMLMSRVQVTEHMTSSLLMHSMRLSPRTLGRLSSSPERFQTLRLHSSWSGAPITHPEAARVHILRHSHGWALAITIAATVATSHGMSTTSKVTVEEGTGDGGEWISARATLPKKRPPPIEVQDLDGDDDMEPAPKRAKKASASEKTRTPSPSIESLPPKKKSTARAAMTAKEDATDDKAGVVVVASATTPIIQMPALAGQPGQRHYVQIGSTVTIPMSVITSALTVFVHSVRAKADFGLPADILNTWYSPGAFGVKTLLLLLCREAKVVSRTCKAEEMEVTDWLSIANFVFGVIYNVPPANSDNCVVPGAAFGLSVHPTSGNVILPAIQAEMRHLTREQRKGIADATKNIWCDGKYTDPLDRVMQTTDIIRLGREVASTFLTDPLLNLFLRLLFSPGPATSQPIREQGLKMMTMK